ncbi:MAG: right-handed parallel beta-helix repeat-containing protein [Gammaproteobacteria bacterium]|nr:right-handed parallel beta-helix repeat-containing protein [Gammaproteobacteria bacterium]
MKRKTLCSFWLLAVIVLLPLAVNGKTVAIGPGDDFEAAANALRPGDHLVLGDGVYTFDERIALTASGKRGKPVVIRAAEGATPILEQATNQNNVIEVVGNEYLVLRGLTVRGGSHGIRLIDADFITIEDCEIYETGDVALSANAKGTYEGLRILRNHIHHTNHTGEGMYLGCNEDKCRIANSLIEGNYVHHTNGPSVTQGDGIEIKKGSYNNIVRNNVIHDTKYPGILLYGTNGNGDPNVVEGNVVWNSGDNTVQIGADARVRNNIILGNVSFQPHQGVMPANIEFVHNTVVNRSHAVEVHRPGGIVTIANNALYSERGSSIKLSGHGMNLVKVSANAGKGLFFGFNGKLVGGRDVSEDFVNGHYNGAPPIDLFPAPGSPLIGAADTRYITGLDFNGMARPGSADIGAYRYFEQSNRSWPIAAGFKTFDPHPVQSTAAP